MKGTLLLCIGFILMQLGMVVFDVEYWPFSGYGVYRQARSLDSVRVPRLSLVSDNKQPEWLYTGDLCRENKIFSDRASFVLRKRPDLIRTLMSEHLIKSKDLIDPEATDLRLELIKVKWSGSDLIFKRKVLDEIPLDPRSL